MGNRKWPLIIAAFLVAGICTETAQAQLLRRPQPVIVVASGGGQQFDFQQYLRWKTMLRISENTHRIEALEKVILQAKLQQLRDKIGSVQATPTSGGTSVLMLPTPQGQASVPQAQAYCPPMQPQTMLVPCVTPRGIEYRKVIRYPRRE